MTGANNPTVLVLAPAFPPSAESGVYRTLKFVKYLERSMWSSVVVSLVPDVYSVLDEDLTAEIPDHVCVYRTSFPRIVARLRDWVDGSTFNPSGTAGQSRTSLWRSILRKLNIFLLPDAFIAWLPYAVLACKAAVRRHHPIVLFASAPPSSAAVIGAMVSRLFALPLVVDFRDGWTVEPYYRQKGRERNWLRYWVEDRLESIVFRQAERVLCQQEVMARSYIAKYPRWGQKITVLNNGFDEDDFVGIKPYEFGRPTLLHTGFLEDRRNPEVFFRALAILRSRRPEVVDKWQVLLVGRTERSFPALVNEVGLEGVVRFHDNVSHRSALSMMLGSSALLLLTGGDESELPGKLFEYIGSRRPIFAVAHPEGESARVMEAAQAGKVVPGASPEAIAAGLESFLDALVPGEASEQKIDLYKLTRQYATEKLAMVLDEVKR